MSVRENHVPSDRLTALAFIAHAPQDEDSADNTHDREALSHVAGCTRCAAELARATAEADQLRAVAIASADRLFDDAMLDTQRTRILARLANLGQVARVLSFPHRTRETAMPVNSGSRRWISVAAAAGLIIGLVTGQLIHFLPWNAAALREDITTIQAPARQLGSGIVTASNTVRTLSDDELLDDVEAAVQLRRAHSLRALDGLTPTAGDLLSMGR